MGIQQEWWYNGNNMQHHYENRWTSHKLHAWWLPNPQLVQPAKISRNSKISLAKTLWDTWSTIGSFSTRGNEEYHPPALGYEDSGYLDVIGQHMGHQLQEWANGDVNPGRNLPLKLGTHSPPWGHLACAHAHRHKHMEKYVHHCTSENLCKFDQICTLSHFWSGEIRWNPNLEETTGPIRAM